MKKFIRFTRVWCPDCASLQPMNALGAGKDDSGQYDGTDLICIGCRLLIATVFQPVGAPEPDAVVQVQPEAR